jgi:hypothetical protein
LHNNQLRSFRAVKTESIGRNFNNLAVFSHSLLAVASYVDYNHFSLMGSEKPTW